MIYLDSAATTLQKPAGVKRAVQRALEEMSSPGRGSHAASRAAAETAFQCRSEAARLFGVPSPENVIFTLNATHALNIAVKSLVSPGGRVVVSGYEHNAVTRPLAAIGGVTITVAESPLFDQEAAVRAFARAIDEQTDAVLCTHVSNVFGCILPVERIALLCAQKGVPLVIDASQSAGVLPIDMARLSPAFIAMPGHKGLYGPQGTGLLLCNHTVKTLLEGGTGSDSLVQEMPLHLPDRLEAGTHNMPGIAGLLAGLRFVRSYQEEKILRHEQGLVRQAVAGLRRLPGVTVYAPENGEAQAGVVSFVAAQRDQEELAEQLAERGVAVRSGLQCAPYAHKTAGTLSTGTVRMSTSVFNTAAEVERFLWELQRIIHRKATF